MGKSLAVLTLTLIFAGCNALECLKPKAEFRVPSSRKASLAKGDPNIILILLDDLDTVSPYREALKKSLARFQAEGIELKNAFASSPVCCPSRASLLTGLYAHNTGVYSNGGKHGGAQAFREPRDLGGARLKTPDGRCIDNEDRTAAVFLHEAGYKTAFIGKYVGFREADVLRTVPGWSYWFAGVNASQFYSGYDYSVARFEEGGSLKTLQFGNREEDYQTDVLKREALKLIRGQKGSDRPLFLSLAPTAPHDAIPPAKRHAALASKRWKGSFRTDRPNYAAKKNTKLPQWLERTLKRRSAALDDDRIQFETRMGSLYAVDEMIDEIFKVLEESGQTKNTVVILTSDNGLNMGAHGLVNKQTPYEESIRVPFFATGPGFAKGTSDKLVLLLDLAPTFLSLANLSPPEHFDGRSLVHVLKNTATEWRRDFLIEYEYFRSNDGIAEELKGMTRPTSLDEAVLLDVPSYRAVRSENYVLIEWAEQKEMESVHEFELFDLKRDPYELMNVAGVPEYRAVFDKLKERLETLKKCSAATCRN